MQLLPRVFVTARGFHCAIRFAAPYRQSQSGAIPASTKLLPISAEEYLVEILPATVRILALLFELLVTTAQYLVLARTSSSP